MENSVLVEKAWEDENFSKVRANPVQPEPWVIGSWVPVYGMEGVKRVRFSKNAFFVCDSEDDVLYEQTAMFYKDPKYGLIVGLFEGSMPTYDRLEISGDSLFVFPYRFFDDDYNSQKLAPNSVYIRE
jgi:hypothetical protein